MCLLCSNHLRRFLVAAPLGVDVSTFSASLLSPVTQVCCSPPDRLPAFAHCVIGQDDGAQYGEVPGPGPAEGRGQTAAGRSGDHRLHFG